MTTFQLDRRLQFRAAPDQQRFRRDWTNADTVNRDLQVVLGRLRDEGLPLPAQRTSFDALLQVAWHTA
jgi:hypothetical protein